jgi:hypothetical protein
MDGRTQITGGGDESGGGVRRVAALVALDGGATARTGRRDPNWIREYGAVVDRLDRLERPRAVVQALAQETARLRREALRLRSERLELVRQLGEVEASIEATRRPMRKPRGQAPTRKQSKWGGE